MANFYGSNSDDIRYGTNYADNIYGYNGMDTLNGYGGNDYIWGGAGNDTINGGYNLDTLVGGQGADYLVGGYDTSTDTFRFFQGDSPSSTGFADLIVDWNVSYDFIDMPITGTSSNYAEASTTVSNISAARSVVEGNASLRAEDHVFLYNAATDTGYLLSDLDRNYSFETGVIIRGAGSASDMNYSDII